MRGACPETRRPFRGYIDVEGRIILCDPLPDAFDRKLLGVTECCVIAVGAKRDCRNCGAHKRSVPRSVADVLTCEIQVKDVGGSGTAVKRKGCWKRINRDGGCDRHWLFLSQGNGCIKGKMIDR